MKRKTKSKRNKVKRTAPARASITEMAFRAECDIIKLNSEVNAIKASLRQAYVVWENLRDALYKSGIIEAKYGSQTEFTAKFKFRADTHIEAL